MSGARQRRAWSGHTRWPGGVLKQALDKVAKRDALANPESIGWFVVFAQAYLGRLEAAQALGR